MQMQKNISIESVKGGYILTWPTFGHDENDILCFQGQERCVVNTEEEMLQKVREVLR